MYAAAVIGGVEPDEESALALGMIVTAPVFHAHFAQGAFVILEFGSTSALSCAGGNLAADNPDPDGRAQGACVDGMILPLAREGGTLPVAVLAPPPAQGALVKPA